MKQPVYRIARNLTIALSAPDVFLIESRDAGGKLVEVSSYDLQFLSYFTSPTSIRDAVVAFSRRGYVAEESLYELADTLIETRILVKCVANRIHGTEKDQGHKLIARSLEINVTEHCNLSCYGCDHAAPIHEEKYISPETLKKDLSILSEIYHAVDFKLTGGEPLLHAELPNIIETVRSSGISDTITLFTNGVLLGDAPIECWSHVDTLYVSAYPGVNLGMSDDDMMSLAEKYDTSLVVVEMDDFLLKLLNNENNDPDFTKYIFSGCGLKAACHTLHAGKYYTCSPAPFIPSWLERIGVTVDCFSGDGVQIQGNPMLREDLREYLIGEKPLNACRFCLGTMGRSSPCRQMSKADLEAWIAEDHSNVYELVDWKRLSERPSLSRLIGAR